MSEPIGYVYNWRDQYIYVLINSDKYRPGISDLLYVKTSDRYVLLQVIGYEGEIPAPPSSFISEPRSKPPLYSIAKTMYAKAVLFFEIRLLNSNGELKPLVLKPNQPPPLDSNVYLISKNDVESEKIMNYLSSGIKPIKTMFKPVPIAWLRSGVAPVDILRNEKYFENAKLSIDLGVTIPKHILVSGQTGSGKTTSVMGIVIQWCWRGEPGLSWLIIDRHGEYSDWRKNSFLDVLSKAVFINNELNTLKTHVYVLQSSGESFETLSPCINRLTGSIDLSSINLYDLASVIELPLEYISELEEISSLITSLFEVAKENNLLPLDWISVFVRNSEATGNLVALIPLLVDNVFKHEGIGEKEKQGLYRAILRTTGVSISKLRVYRRIILSYLSLRIEHKRLKTISGLTTISILNDNESVFKTTPLLKNENALVKILIALLEALSKVKLGFSPVLNSLKSIKIDENSLANITRLTSGSIAVSDIVNKLNDRNSSVVVIDVSKIPTTQGDIVVMSILRRLFEYRMSIGVEASRELSKVAVVSEEAPLYLNPEKVSSPYNVFARLAREGRKFGIGLIAITQLATDIEKQILANFNTIIALRTKYSTDLNYYNNIGIPSETLTLLSDREGYLYTPDLSVKEPIPVYIPGYFDYITAIDNEYFELIEKKEYFEKNAGKVLSSIMKKESDLQ